MREYTQSTTDLALESAQLWRERNPGELPGVRSRELLRCGFPVTEVEVLNEEGERAVGKPPGRYRTIETGPRQGRSADYLQRLSEALAQELRELLDLKEGSRCWWWGWATGPSPRTRWDPGRWSRPW